MEEFFSDLNVLFFKEWIKNQQSDLYHISYNKNWILLETNYGKATITFNDSNIIELIVTNEMTKKIEFYLHFQMNSIKHALELYYEMIFILERLVVKPKLNVLLVCSGGMTTGFFADQLNETIKALNKDIRIEALPYASIYSVASNFDIILLAPQVSYIHAQAQEVLKDKIVAKIPPIIFAKYDVMNMIRFIDELSKTDKEEQQVDPFYLDDHHNNQVLVLSVFRNRERVHIVYRLYKGNDILLDNEMIKYKIYLSDLFDVIDPILVNYPDINKIGLSIPGIIDQGILTSSYIEGIIDGNIVKAFEDKYDQAINISNDVNAAVYGYYALHKEYQSPSLLFQPVASLAGLGSVVNGLLNVGSNHVAGEVQFLPLALSNDRITLSSTPEGALELVSKILGSIICINNPDLIVLFCDLITDINQLKQEISNIVPINSIPMIHKIDNLLEYILLGQLKLCIEEK